MPFVRKTNPEGSQPPPDTRKLFIGRTGELLFFVQNILKPEEPSHNIISIWGQGGVGKSTLLARFIDEARSIEFKDYCLTAIVDELQTTPANMMEKFAAQLHMQGTFEKSLKHYKEMLRTVQTERETLQDTLVQRMPTFAGAAIEGVPFVGPLLGEGVKVTAEHFMDKHHHVHRHKDAELLEDPIKELTRAFVDELNQLVETQVLLGSQRVKKHRVILFFDTFEQLAIEAVPWLLNYFLQADIKSNVVLVMAGRDSIERSIPDETKRWLPCCDNETIYWIPLNSFTEDETRTYLVKRDITDPERIATIWELSQGLPLYLGLLTSNPDGKVDPTADVVANFLRWIPKEEHIKRQLALDAALFSKPFNQDDLEVFIYVPKSDRIALYEWHINKEQDTAIARVLRDLSQEPSPHPINSAAWEITVQLLNYVEDYFSQAGLAAAGSLIEKVANAPNFPSELLAGLYFRRAMVYNTRSELFNRGLASENFQQALKFFRSTNYYYRGFVYFYSGNYREALVVHEQALEQNPQDADAYFGRGWAYTNLREYEQAIADFEHVLELAPNYNNPGGLYNGLRWAYYWAGQYQQALSANDHLLERDPERYYLFRSQFYPKLQAEASDFGNRKGAGFGVATNIARSIALV